MLLARRQAELAAGSRSSVALVGPPGSGRQHLAAAIHYAGVSSRPLAASQAAELLGNVRDPALLPLDCPLLGADFVAAVLAAVGRATTQRAPMDATGTLLLHRVDELPAEVQLQLVELLARRLAQWRLIATAAAPLAELARRGTFHAELAAQLSTITIELPPLGRAPRRPAAVGPVVSGRSQRRRLAADRRLLPGGARPARRLRLAGQSRRASRGGGRGARGAAGRQIDESDLPERLRLAAQAAAHPRAHRRDDCARRVSRPRRAGTDPPGLGPGERKQGSGGAAAGRDPARLYRRMVQLGLE